LPACARNSYPVETKCCLDYKNSHLGRSAAAVFDLVMPTCGNGEFCSGMLYDVMNCSYLERVEDCYSFYKEKQEKEVLSYLEKDGSYIVSYPPLGDGIRDSYDVACSNPNTPWQISDHDRHTREIQSVGCRLTFAQDHTHEVSKNYFQKKRMGAVALWDLATETGEIASAVVVPSTKTIHLAHAAAQLSRRGGFNPSAMCSDTWPSKSDFWDRAFNSELQGRLGLFHFIQRITKTLKKKHTDYFMALNGQHAGNSASQSQS